MGRYRFPNKGVAICGHENQVTAHRLLLIQCAGAESLFKFDIVHAPGPGDLALDPLHHDPGIPDGRWIFETRLCDLRRILQR